MSLKLRRVRAPLGKSQYLLSAAQSHSKARLQGPDSGGYLRSMRNTRLLVSSPRSTATYSRNGTAFINGPQIPQILVVPLIREYCTSLHYLDAPTNVFP